MANIFTRKAMSDIMSKEGLTPEERTEQVMSLYGRALDDGYISKSAAQTAQEEALTKAKTEWEKGLQTPDPKESDDYKALQTEFANYKTMQAARSSEDYKEVKPKFFDTVYGMVDRKDGAKPIKDQLAEIRKSYDEYFVSQQGGGRPQFGAGVQGGMPSGNEGATKGFSGAWGFAPKKN